MRFLNRNQDYYRGYYSKRNYRHLYKLATFFVTYGLVAYILICFFLYFRQDYIIYKANDRISASSPGDRDFQLDHQDVWIDVIQSNARIHGWWFSAPGLHKPIVAIPNEPVNILTTPKTILYLCGRGSSKTHYNNLARIKGFQQLGFSVLAIDYRGYGLSEGVLPNETRLYEDGQAAWGLFN